MESVNIYLYTTIRGPGKRQGAFSYVLEKETEKGPATLTNAKALGEASERRAELVALAAALKRLKKPCTLSIYADCGPVAAAFEQGWMEKWVNNNWKNAKDQPIANREEWQEVAKLLGRHRFCFIVGQKHSYYNWMREEAEREERKCTKDLENLIPQKGSTKQP